MSSTESWMDKVVEAHSHAESPKRYYWWSAAAIISAIMRKRVYLDKFEYKLYPNMYTLLISSTSGLRKGPPIAFAERILTSLNCTRSISGQNSIQAVLQELGSQVTNEGEQFDDAQGILLSGELRNLLLDDPQSMTVLTELYNTHENPDKWKKTLKTEKLTLKQPCISLLGASNERLLDDMIKDIDIEGGFIARCMIVHESQPNATNSLMWKPEVLVPEKDLLEYPKSLIPIKGEFKIDTKVRKEYDKWYKSLEKLRFNNEDRTGTLNRIADHVLKLGMVISLSKDHSLEISMEDMENAIDKCMSCFSGTKQISMGGGKSESSPAILKVIKILCAAPELTISRHNLQKKIGADFDVFQLDKVIATLDNKRGSNMLVELNIDGKIHYRMNKEAYEGLMKMNANERRVN